MKLIVKKLIIIIFIQSVLLCSELSKLDIACKIGVPAVACISSYYIYKGSFKYAENQIGSIRNDNNLGYAEMAPEEAFRDGMQMGVNFRFRRNDLDRANLKYLLKASVSGIAGIASLVLSFSHGCKALSEVKNNCQLI